MHAARPTDSEKTLHKVKRMESRLISALLLLSILTTQSCHYNNEPQQAAGYSPHEPATIPDQRCVGGATFENETIDCAGARIGLSCNGDDEHQPAVLTLKNASVKNLIVTADGGADGIHCVAGDCILENVVWEDICEDAATLGKAGNSLVIRGGWAFNSLDGVGGKPDKIFQHNAGPHSTVIVTGGFTAKGVNGKLWRSCGNCKKNTGPRHLIVDNVRIEGKMNTVAGPNVNEGYGDTVTISNLFVQNYRPRKPKICRAFIGSKREEKAVDSEPLGEQWNTNHCRVDLLDITSF